MEDLNFTVELAGTVILNISVFEWFPLKCIRSISSVKLALVASDILYLLRRC